MGFKDTAKNFLNSYGGFLVAAAALATVVIVLNVPLTPSYDGSDSKWYLAIATGHIDTVVKPFSSRFLHPFLAGWISSHFSLDLAQSFLLINAVSLFLFFVIVSSLFKKVLRWAPLLFLVFPLPFFIERFADFFSPDIFYVFLTALFFLFLYYEREGLSLLTLFFLFLARESTVLLGFVFLVVTLMRSKRMTAAAALVVVVISFFTASQIGNLGIPNAHHLSNFAYLIVRIPFLTLQNLGITPWVNTLPGTCVPLFRLGLPHLSFLGDIREFGFCGFHLSVLVNTLTSFLSVFGVMPAVLWYLLSRKRKEIIKGVPRWLLIALLYGVGYYLITIGSTTGVSRFVGYSWPALLLATPFLAQRYLKMDARFAVKILLIHMSVTLLPFLVEAVGGFTLVPKVIVLFIVAACNVYTFRLLSRRETAVRRSDPVAAQPCPTVNSVVD